VRPGDCFVPFHWNDLFGENLAVNAATSEAVDPISLQPEFKFAAVSLARVELKLSDGFSPEQKAFLHELLSGMALRLSVNGSGQPEIPANAPFTAHERKHLDDLIAQFCTDHSKIEKP
jgi:hypothetical protein